MKNITIIGDVHGKVYQYSHILNKLDKDSETIQVGDFGFRTHHEWHINNVDSNKHKINFGNHDDYTFLNKPHSLGNYSYLNDEIMTVRGAYSIDKEYRTEDVSWWKNEELNYQEFQEAIDFYSDKKPKIMITHECPQEIRRFLFNIEEKSITSNGLQSMFEIYQPDLWIFGHHHKKKCELINGTKFICLGELDTIDL